MPRQAPKTPAETPSANLPKNPSQVAEGLKGKTQGDQFPVPSPDSATSRTRDRRSQYPLLFLQLETEMERAEVWSICARRNTGLGVAPPLGRMVWMMCVALVCLLLLPGVFDASK